jgi:hypothetical protein
MLKAGVYCRPRLLSDVVSSVRA